MPWVGKPTHCTAFRPPAYGCCNAGPPKPNALTIIDDPWAVQLWKAIDYDYSSFGRPIQAYALRAKLYDDQTAAYLHRHPGASVVALAEGLQTSFWRLDRTGLINESHWYSIDLAPIISLRQQFLPSDQRITALAQSALDRSWMEHIDPSRGVFHTAEGLFMYLQPEQVLGLIADCATNFPGGAMLFDSIPPWLSRRSKKGVRLSRDYTLPHMPFGTTADEMVNLTRRIAGVTDARDIAFPSGRGAVKILSHPRLDRIGLYRRNRPSFTLLNFAPTR